MGLYSLFPVRWNTRLDLIHSQMLTPWTVGVHAGLVLPPVAHHSLFGLLVSPELQKAMEIFNQHGENHQQTVESCYN